MKFASMTAAIAIATFSCAEGTHAADKPVPKAKSASQSELYALAMICGVSGNGNCERAFFKMPAGLTKDGCKGMGMLYRGKLLGADETGDPGRVDTWECFTSQLPVKGAVSLGD